MKMWKTLLTWDICLSETVNSILRLEIYDYQKGYTNLTLLKLTYVWIKLTIKALDLRVLIETLSTKLVSKLVLHLSSLSSNIIQFLKSVSADMSDKLYRNGLVNIIVKMRFQHFEVSILTLGYITRCTRTNNIFVFWGKYKLYEHWQLYDSYCMNIW